MYSIGTLRFSKRSFPETKCLPHTRSLLRTYFAFVSPRLIAYIHFSLLSLVNSSSKVDLFCITDGIRSNPIPSSRSPLLPQPKTTQRTISYWVHNGANHTCLSFSDHLPPFLLICCPTCQPKHYKHWGK